MSNKIFHYGREPVLIQGILICFEAIVKSEILIMNKILSIQKLKTCKCGRFAKTYQNLSLYFYQKKGTYISNAFNGAVKQKEGGQWAVYYTSPQSFIITFSYLLT